MFVYRLEIDMLVYRLAINMFVYPLEMDYAIHHYSFSSCVRKKMIYFFATGYSWFLVLILNSFGADLIL